MLPSLVFGEYAGVLFIQPRLKLMYFSYENMYERIRVHKYTSWWLNGVGNLRDLRKIQKR